jgi:hypothetical protein
MACFGNRSVLGLAIVLLARGLFDGGGGPLWAAESTAKARYVGVLTDGTRVEGTEIRHWEWRQEKPTLEGRELFNDQRPLRWLCDQTLRPFDAEADGADFVEFVNGDRLPGRVLGAMDEGPGQGEPPQLLVDLKRPGQVGTGPSAVRVRVAAAAVRRVIWGGGAGRTVEPGTLLYRDGRRIAYESLRWQSDALSVLVEDGVRRVPLAELSEVDLPPTDPWQSYLEELARIDPDCSSRLVRIETTGGMVVTCSQSDLQATGAGKEPAAWQHLVQPAWSLDPIWIPFLTARSWLFFAPQEVPLSRLPPTRFASRPLIGKGWSWCAEGNVEGGPLENAQGRFGWGFGVHAPCEMWFDLPPAAEGFRARVGLDRLAGTGGCARGLVYLDRVDGTPLYRSKQLIGSGEAVETGTLKLGGRAGGKRSLVLVADACEHDAPPDADPLDIRDFVDWAEPTLLLDLARLKAGVQGVLGSTVRAWKGWSVAVDGGGPIEGRYRVDSLHGAGLVFLRGISTGKRSVSFSAEREITEADGWLIVRVQWLSGRKLPSRFEVRVDGRAVARHEVPPHLLGASFCVPLQRYEDKKVKLEMIYQPGDEGEFVDWQALVLGDRSQQMQWKLVTVLGAHSLAGTVLTPQRDGSVVAGGPLPAGDVYVVTARCDLPEVNAFRLEPMNDDSLPSRGPGRGVHGGFLVSNFSAALMNEGVDPPRGRFVRLERPKSPTKYSFPLALAEVQVFSGAEDVALGGKASQSSVEGASVAARAIDNNTDDQRDGESIAQTKTEDANPWWEVDLGGDKSLDRIVLWNAAERLGKLQNLVLVSVLDNDRKSVWQRLVDASHGRGEEIYLRDGTEVPLRLGARSNRVPLPTGHYGRNHTATSHEVVGRTGLALSPAIYYTNQPIDPRGKTLVFTIKHPTEKPESLLGRFRIWATSEKSPTAPALPGEEVPLLPEK